MSPRMMEWAGARALTAALGLALLAAIAGPVAAQPVAVPETYGGDFWTRPKLTGSWGGLRDELGKRGVVVDVDFYQTLQGVIDGGRSTGVGYDGHADYTLNVDTGKLGLWPGGFLRLHAETNYGTDINFDSGAIQAPNGLALFPMPNQSQMTITNLTFAQFLAPWVGVMVGKIEGYGGDDNAFAHGLKNNFLNLGLAFNLTLEMVPISSLGGIIILVPWDGAVFTAGVLDPNGKPDETGFDHLFADGVYVTSEGRVTIKPFGLVGHQLVGFAWSNKERISLIQDTDNILRTILFSKFPRLQDPGPILRKIIEKLFPGLLQPLEPFNKVHNTWSVYYNFDQYLWSPKGDPTRGIGPFFRFGITDGVANPVKYHYNVGIGGKGVVPGRPRDTFGIGWSRMELSSHLVPFLREHLHLGLSREDAVEAFYNFALTGSINATLDLQVIDPAFKKIQLSGGRFQNMDTAVVGGFRLGVQF